MTSPLFLCKMSTDFIFYMETHLNLIEKYSNLITDRLIVLLETYTEGKYTIEENEDIVVVKQLLGKYLELMLSEFENNGQ